MASSLSWYDQYGVGTLTNGKITPGDRFSNWAPRRLPIGPASISLGTGRIHRFEFRRDDIVAFQINAIPEAEMESMLRLQYHLLSGGGVTVVTDRQLGANYATASLAPDTTPEIQASDPQLREYTFAVELVVSTANSGDFYPAFAPGLLLWLNADSMKAFEVDGAALPQWNDDSGNGHHATQSVTNRYPVLRYAAINGHAAVEFGGEKYLITNDIIQPTAGSTLFVVMKRTGAYSSHGAFVGYGQAIASGGTSGSDEAAIEENVSGDLSWYIANGSPGNTEPLAVGTSTSWNIVRLGFATTNSCVPAVNGVAGPSFDPYNIIEGSNFQRVFVGAANGSGVWYGANCQLAEVLEYAPNLAPNYVTDIEAYLGTKYGITVV